jgi:[acyl-carrier-protein] S-malonyltransferase
MEMAKTRGASRAIPLNVNGAFHSSLMRSAGDRFVDIVAEAPFRDATVPIVANVSAKPITDSKDLKEEVLQQICAPVQWQRSVQYMAQQKVTSYLEIGPGNVLSGLIKRIVSNAQTLNLNSVDSIQNWDGK